MSDGQTESQSTYSRQHDNDGSRWVCPECGSTRDGPSITTMCPKGCQMMVRAAAPRDAPPGVHRCPTCGNWSDDADVAGAMAQWERLHALEASLTVERLAALLREWDGYEAEGPQGHDIKFWMSQAEWLLPRLWTTPKEQT